MTLTKDSEPYLPPPVVIDALDQPVWNFLATFAVHSSSEEQQIMVTILREKILDTVLSASQEWSAEGGAHRIANVNLVCEHVWQNPWLLNFFLFSVPQCTWIRRFTNCFLVVFLRATESLSLSKAVRRARNIPHTEVPVHHMCDLEQC